MELKPIYKEIIRFVFTVAASSSIGGYFAYQNALTIPVPAQYAVVDMAEVARIMNINIDPTKPSGQIRIKEMTDVMKSQFSRYTDAGIVVLDASQVITAPKESYLDPKNLLDGLDLR